MNDEYSATNQDLQKSLEFYQEEVYKLRACLYKIEEAITKEGPVPLYHRHVVRKHRSEWPTLHKAIDNALEVLHGKK